MRRLIYLTLGFAAACGLMQYLDSWQIRVPVVCVLLLFAAFAEKKSGAVQRTALTLLGCILGLGWFLGYSARYLKPIAALDCEVVSCSIRASDFSRETQYGTAMDGTVDISGITYQVTAYLDRTEPLLPGECVTGDFRLRITSDAGENPSSYYQGKGIFLLAYQAEPLSRDRTPQVWKDIPAKLRRQISSILQTCLPVDCVPFAKALLLGDTSGLSYKTDTDLKVSGIRHVAAVSGLHVSILFALIGAVTFRKRIFTALAGIPVLFLFAAIAGFTPSVNRACIMSALTLLAQMLNKEYDGPTALAFAVLVMLVQNPYTISSVSFQLSVAGVMGIFLVAPGIRSGFISRIGQRKGRVFGFLRKAASAVAVTLGAQIFTIPLCACYFGVVSLVGVLTNLLVLWVISLIFCVLTVLCLTAFISVSLAGLLGAIAAVLIRYVLLVARALAAFPLAAVYTVSPYISLWLIFAYLLLFLYFAAGKRRVSSFVCYGILGLCAALTAAWLEPIMSDVSVTVLDVGQGQCILVQSGGRNYMVDCGGDSDSRTADLAAEVLLSRGFSRIDGLILTHPDRDHAGAAENFLSRIPTNFLIMPSSPVSFSVPEQTQTIYAESDLQISDDNASISVFAPVYGSSGNEISLCVLFDTENCDILITGDRDSFGERSLLRHAQIPKVDVLIAGHHGARSSTCEELLNAVQPEIVCISAGEGNPYGHPAPELLQRLSDFGCSVLRTDQQGTITIRR